MAWTHKRIYHIDCTNGTSTTGKRLVVQSTGRLWTIFSDNTSDEIKVGYSDDNGWTWTNQTMTSATHAQTPHAILIDTNNRICILYGGPIDSSVSTYALWFRRRLTNGTWEDPVQVIANTGKPPRMATMACEWSSQYHVTWVQSTLTIGYGTYSSSDRATIDHCYSEDGYAFSAPTTLTNEPSPLECRWPAIVFDSYNVGHIVYITNTWSTGAEKLMYMSNIAGWQTPAMVIGANVTSVQMLACGPTDNLHVMYTDTTGLMYIRRDFIGYSWTGNATLMSGYYGWEGTLSVDLNDKVSAICSYETSYNKWVTLRTLVSGGSWSGHSSITNYGMDRYSALQQNLPFYAPASGIAFVSYAGPYNNEIWYQGYVVPSKSYSGGMAYIL